MADRESWLEEKRRVAEKRMDTLFASDYDEFWGQVDPTHEEMLSRFLSLCPPGCTVLDAACGTGKYWSMALGSGRSVVGVDHSRRTLANAGVKFPEVPVEKLRLREIGYEEAFDGLICIDAMENVPPEDWPVVLRNFRRALKADAYLYLTIETAAAEEVQAAFFVGQAMGFPLVEGEWVHEGWYHFYRDLAEARKWVSDARFEILEERAGDGYHHFLARRESGFGEPSDR